MIVFQRYGKYGKKNNCMINFPSDLDLSRYIDKDLINNKNCEYSLKGISNHSGNMNFGHYYRV